VDDPPRARQHSQVSQKQRGLGSRHLQRKKNPQPIPMISNLTLAHTWLGLELSSMLLLG